MMNNQVYRVVGLGEVLWDIFPGGRQLGGAPANFAYHAHALGADSALVSRVGEDSRGREILDRLNALQIDTEHVSVDPEHATGTVEVKLDSAGKPTYDIKEDVAWDYLPYTEKMQNLARMTDAVCFGTLCSRSSHSRASIQSFLEDVPERAIRVLDVNLRQHYYSEDLIRTLLKYADVLKLSDDELPTLVTMLDINGGQDDNCRELMRSFALDLVALTKGKKGSILYSPNQKSEQPAAPGEVVDTVGAGDSFTAALVLGLLNQVELDHINAIANRVATFVCGQSGATPELPDKFRGELAG